MDYNLYLTDSQYLNHVAQLAPAVQDLAMLEAQTQINFLKRMRNQ